MKNLAVPRTVEVEASEKRRQENEATMAEQLQILTTAVTSLAASKTVGFGSKWENGRGE